MGENLEHSIAPRFFREASTPRGKGCPRSGKRYCTNEHAQLLAMGAAIMPEVYAAHALPSITLISSIYQFSRRSPLSRLRRSLSMEFYLTDSFSSAGQNHILNFKLLPCTRTWLDAAMRVACVSNLTHRGNPTAVSGGTGICRWTKEWTFDIQTVDGMSPLRYHNTQRRAEYRAAAERQKGTIDPTA